MNMNYMNKGLDLLCCTDKCSFGKRKSVLHTLGNQFKQMWPVTHNQENSKNEDGHVYVYQGKLHMHIKNVWQSHSVTLLLWNHLRSFWDNFWTTQRLTLVGPDFAACVAMTTRENSRNVLWITFDCAVFKYFTFGRTRCMDHNKVRHVPCIIPTVFSSSATLLFRSVDIHTEANRYQ